MNIYGVRGYLTPDSLPVDDHCRTFAIPNDVQWLSVFMGALLPLIYPENWQQFGSLTPEESAEVMLNVIWDAYENDLGICQELGAPYWDTTANVDDEFPPQDIGFVALDVPTVWFGELKVIDGNLTWVENLFIWAVAGFIAYAGQPAGAIAFVPFAQRFVLAFKAHDLGGIIKVFIDGELVDLIDTYQPSASIITRPIFTDNSGEPHDLWVAMSDDVNPAVTGTPFIQVVRKELSESEVYPANRRYDAGTDTVQTFSPTADSFVDTPESDPRHNTGFQRPPITADDPKCQAASNMARWIHDFIDEVANTLSWASAAEGMLTTIMGAVAVVFPEGAAVGVFALLGLDLATTIFSAGLTAIQDAFTNDVYDQLICIFYCRIETNGTVTADELAGILADVNDQIGGLVFAVLTAMFFLMGEVGLTNAGITAHDPSPDCSSCACDTTLCIGFDDGDPYEFYADPEFPLVPAGHLNPDFGNPAPSGHSDTNFSYGSYQLWLGVKVDLGDNRAVNAVNFDYFWYSDNPGGSIFRGIYFLDADLAIIAQQTGAIAASQSVWLNYAYTGDPVPGCRFIAIALGQTGGSPITGELTVDNICTTWSA